jgi:NAD(P)-dependent dehydrogenase (short-subunit alcohol dehydrogenase family)
MPTVFITGGARRIGRGLALRFAERGYDVGITYRTSETEARTLGDEMGSIGAKYAAVQCDVRRADEIVDALAALRKEVGMPSVIVSNAGILPPRRSLTALSEKDLAETLQVNTYPLLTLAKVFHQWVKEEGTTGRLISLSSLGAREIWKDRIDYHVSKSALVNLGNALARSMAPSITVNTVAPGIIAFPDDEGQGGGTGINVERIPMKRYGSATDVCDAVWFFATSSAYITGQYLAVDGGYHLER